MKFNFSIFPEKSQKITAGLLVAAIIVILSLILIIESKKNKPPLVVAPTITPTPSITPTPTPRDSETIMVTNGKFVPEKITIKRGSLINFINLTNNPINIESADHPKHQLYPELNLGIVKTNDTTKSVDFEKAGIYQYHNDNNLKMQGEIIVQ